MASHARGTFEVTLNREPPYFADAGATLARTSIIKQFQGELEGSSQVEMLSAGTKTKGSAGYVAIERVTGTLNGRAGTFVLQHSGSMNRGKAELTVTVVPDSGSAELTGLVGKMTIDIVEGRHFYDFDYALGEPA
jgi:hypothetical protein